MKRRDDLPAPLNAQEHLLYAIAVRQDILIEQMNSVVDYIAKQEKVATTNHTNVEKVVPKKTVAKSVPSVDKPVEVKAETAKPAPKRAPVRKTTKKEK